MNEDRPAAQYFHKEYYSCARIIAHKLLNQKYGAWIHDCSVHLVPLWLYVKANAYTDNKQITCVLLRTRFNMA